MIHYRNRHTRWFVLLTVGAAFVILWCHTLAAATHTDGGIDVLQTFATAPAYVNGHDLTASARSMDCRVALSGSKAFAGKLPPSSTAASAVALYPLPLPIQPASEVLHAVPTVTAPHRTSLQHQSVLIRI